MLLSQGGLEHSLDVCPKMVISWYDDTIFIILIKFFLKSLCIKTDKAIE